MQEEETDNIDLKKKSKEKNVFNTSNLYSDDLPEYYPGKQLNQHANSLRDSIIISSDAINYVLDKFIKALQNKRIEQNQIFFVRDIFLINCTVITRATFHKCDLYGEYPNKPTLIQNLDHEPEPIDVYDITLISRVKQVQDPIPNPKSKIEERQQQSPVQKKQTQYIRQESIPMNQPNKLIKKGKQKPLSKIIQIDNDQADTSQDQLRYDKLYKQELQKQEEEANKFILMEQQKQNTNMRILQNKLNGQYTFDYNGKILKIKQVSPDILPDIDTSPKYSFQEVIDKVNKKNVRRKGIGLTVKAELPPIIYLNQDEAPSPSRQNNDNEEEYDDKQIKKPIKKPLQNKGYKAQTGEIYKNYTNAILNLDQLKPMRGVTLYHKFHIKQGPDPIQIETLQDLFQKLSGTQPLDKLKISRSEYRALVQNGNMNKTGAFKTNKMSQEGLKNWNGIYPQPDEEDVSIISEDFNENLKDPYFTNKSNRSGSDFCKFSFIKINSNNLVKKMIKLDPKQEDNLQQQMLQKSKSQQQLKETINIPRTISPINDFNRTIMKSDEWGKNILGGTMRQSKFPIKVQKKQIETPKLSPRERYRIKNSKIGIYASQQLMSQKEKQLLQHEKEKGFRK